MSHFFLRLVFFLTGGRLFFGGRDGPVSSVEALGIEGGGAFGLLTPPLEEGMASASGGKNEGIVGTTVGEIEGDSGGPKGCTPSGRFLLSSSS